MGKLKKTEITCRETHIVILSASKPKTDIRREVIRQRGLLDAYILGYPLFLSSYSPQPAGDDAPDIAKAMADAAQKAGVGPMAAVAGAFSDYVGGLLASEGQEEYIVENGGDIFLRITEPRTVGVYAGPSEYSGRIGFRVTPQETPLGICTSSASVGPSVSLGKSDAVTVLARTSALADAAATAIGNEVTGKDGVERGLKKAKEIAGVRGVLVIIGGEMGAWGSLPHIIKIPSIK